MERGWQLEAKCEKCGEVFLPADEHDLIHSQTEMAEECGGKGTVLGAWWGSSTPPTQPLVFPKECG